MQIFETFRNIFAIPDLRKRVLFTFGLLAIYRIGSHIPTPGLDASALEEFFKSEVPGEAKARVKGVRGEITAVKGAVIKANQKKHEYVAQCEELEQMKRLGIKDSAP